MTQKGRTKKKQKIGDQMMKDLVYEVLRENPKARDDRRLLDLLVISKLSQSIITDKEIIIFRDGMKNLPSPETISRIARYYQNTLKIFEPSIIIKNIRIKKEEEYTKKYLR